MIKEAQIDRKSKKYWKEELLRARGELKKTKDRDTKKYWKLRIEYCNNKKEENMK